MSFYKGSSTFEYAQKQTCKYCLITPELAETICSICMYFDKEKQEGKVHYPELLQHSLYQNHWKLHRKKMIVQLGQVIKAKSKERLPRNILLEPKQFMFSIMWVLYKNVILGVRLVQIQIL